MLRFDLLSPRALGCDPVVVFVGGVAFVPAVIFVPIVIFSPPGRT
jgi:hypothetical protein